MKFQMTTGTDYQYFHVTHCVQKESTITACEDRAARLTSRILVLSKSCNTSNVSGAAETVSAMQRSVA